MREVKYLSIKKSSFYDEKGKPIKCTILEEAIGPFNHKDIYKILEDVNERNYIKQLKSCKTLIRSNNQIIDKFNTYPNYLIKQKEKEIKDILKRTTSNGLRYNAFQDLKGVI